MVARTRRRATAGLTLPSALRVRGWELWRVPAPARAFLLATELVALGLTVGLVGYNGAISTPTLFRLLVLAALSIGYSEFSARSTRMQRYLGDRTFANPLSVWSYAAVLTVPAGWAAAFIVLQYGHTSWQRRRDRTGPSYRAAFTAAAAMNAQLATALVVALGGWRSGHHDQTLASLVVLAGVVAFTVVNMTIVLTGIWLAVRPPSIRMMIPDRDDVGYEVATLILGIVAAEFLLRSPALLPAILVLVAVLHRSSVIKALQHEARTDAKTGLLTATAWREEARTALTRTARDGAGVTVLLLDLDHFKQVNDRHGHLVGDHVLSAVSACLRQELRPHDAVGRFGGEEFVVLLESPGPGVAVEIAGRLCAAVRDVRVDDDDVRVTVSIGVSRHSRGTDDGTLIDTLLHEADAALYEAKQAGRDQVRVAKRTVLSPFEQARTAATSAAAAAAARLRAS